ncbi:MAG: hypothetical protein DWQ47_12830 [Acidobacteria bacterium]|nr:MAG: hypothetical protein DWQ32_00230 [Acidobacteriota bacterium]REK03034.1 MAG: hypothetical protein DWQ38_11905 [Acidobacteriota bacterium]REK13162.1 MAG: hypothetical protein DWQ43_05920 [Acidobacteriota bacterium]REK41156.1 MAG: hypothetical protein DWQ47_12830 [Acidobacteriota bacterium]
MNVENRTDRKDEFIASITGEISEHVSLSKVLAWAADQPEGETLKHVVSDVIVQDEYTHDAIVPWKDGLVIVYGIT